MKDKETLPLKQQMSLKCPLMYHRLDKMSNMEGAHSNLPSYVKQIYIDILTSYNQNNKKIPYVLVLINL